MKQVLIAAILLYSGSMVAQNRSINFEKTTFDSALSKAKSANKLVFVDCITSWCGPCKQMSKYVFTQDSVADFFDSNFVNLQLDMEKGEGVTLRKEYNVEAYPTFLLLNSNRKVVYRFVGGMIADSFMLKIRQGMNPANRVAILNERYEAGERTKDLLREYIQIKLDGKEISVAQKIANEYFDMLSPKEKLLPENWFLFGENKYSMYLSNIHSRTFNYMAGHYADFAKVSGREAVESKMRHMYQQITEYSLRGWYLKEAGNKLLTYDKREFDGYRTQIKNSKLEDKEQLLALVDIAQAAVEKDTSLVTTLMIKHIGGFSAENQKATLSYFIMFPASERKRNARVQQVIDAVIKSDKSERMVQFVKSL